MRLGYHDLADIRLRRQLRLSTPEDVEALLDEVDDLLDDFRKVALQCGDDAVVTPYDVAELVRARLADAEEAAAKVRELEAFERGCHAVMAAFKASPDVVDLLGSGEPLANPGEFCLICSAGHADECGFCERHGKKVRGLWTEKDGPTQTGLICLVALAAPLFELVGKSYKRAESVSARKPPVSTPRRRNARRAP